MNDILGPPDEGGRAVEQAGVEYDYDGEPENGLPPIALARRRLEKSISEWGDGDVLEGFNTRDMCALLAALDRIDSLADWFDAQVNWREWRIGTQIRNAFEDPRTRRAYPPASLTPERPERPGGAD